MDSIDHIRKWKVDLDNILFELSVGTYDSQIRILEKDILKIKEEMENYNELI